MHSPGSVLIKTCPFSLTGRYSLARRSYSASVKCFMEIFAMFDYKRKLQSFAISLSTSEPLSTNKRARFHGFSQISFMLVFNLQTKKVQNTRLCAGSFLMVAAK